MKTAMILFAGLMMSVSAFADQKVSMTCTGHELLPGNAGKTAKVVIEASTQYDANVLNRPWNVDIRWQGADSAMIGDGVLCGQAMDADVTCSETAHNLGVGAYKIAKECHDKQGSGFPPNNFTRSAMVLDSTGTHGRFSCSFLRFKAYKTVELTDCRSN